MPRDSRYSKRFARTPATTRSPRGSPASEQLVAAVRLGWSRLRSKEHARGLPHLLCHSWMRGLEGPPEVHLGRGGWHSSL
eukprot:3167139-Lingulodinium_polyedra.AAC.1